VSQRPSGHLRVPGEVYETPPWVTQCVVPYLCKHALRVWDPANGPASKITQALDEVGFHVTATRDDFLAQKSLPDSRIDAIVSNPPFGVGGRLAVRFIEHALALDVSVVVMLTRIDFDSGKTRRHLFADCKAFAHKIILLDRIVWFEREGAAGPSENHCWMLWNRRHRGPPTISYAGRS
jgi:hypothetical protein